MKRNVIKIFAVLAKVALVVLLACLAFFSFLAVHEWAGHILADEIVFARHGATLTRLEVIVQWLSVNLQDGRWSVALVPFRIGAKVDYAFPANPITLMGWELGFANFMGAGITTLISLAALTVLNLRTALPRFPWFAGFFSLWSMIFDQIFEAFLNPAEALNGAVRMGADPILFKIIVIGLVLLQGWLLVRIGIRYLRGRQARSAGYK